MTKFLLFFTLLFLSFLSFASENNIDKQGAEGLTSLHLAVKNNDLPQTTNLLNQNASPEIKDIYGRTPLFYSQNLEITKILVAKNANINSADNWQTSILARAISFRNFDIALFLIEKGADINATDSWGCKPIHKAAARGDIEIVKVILQKNKSAVNVACNDGEAPLYYAAGNANYEMVRLLLENGADKSLKTKEGLSAIDVGREDIKGMIKPITVNSEPKIIEARKKIINILSN